MLASRLRVALRNLSEVSTTAITMFLSGVFCGLKRADVEAVCAVCHYAIRLKTAWESV